MCSLRKQNLNKTMLTRRELRVDSMKFLYILEVGGEYEKDIVEPEVYEFVNQIIEHNDEVEKTISSSLTGWTIKRLNLVDKCILKIAVYEMQFLNQAPEIAINEALEITKEFSDLGDKKQVAFNNKVLDKAKDLINARK